LGGYRQSCKHESWRQWSLMQTIHCCANQRQVLDLKKAQILKIKIEVHKHGFLTKSSLLEFFLKKKKKNIIVKKLPL
jgi:hypothetical protein